MAALARAAPCPRLFLRSTTTTSSSSTSASRQPTPPSPPRPSRRIVRCSAAAYYSPASLCLAPPSSCQQQQQQQQQRRSFACTRSVRRDLAKRNHYERLQVPQSATPGDIKKSFYKLSKTHHPDANRKDPDAAHTFSLLSESYKLLSDPSRRSLYDRDVMARLHPPSYAHSPPHGSYHSAAAHNHHHHHHHHPAGGRPASGLSKRRGSFRGPPPSFYRNGGWGAHADRRRRAHDETASSASSSSSSSSHYTNYESPGHGRLDDEGVPLHFDKEAHRRTHEREDRRRWARRRRALDEEGIEFEPQTSLGAHFAIVLGILGATVLVPVWYWNTVSGKRRKEF